MKQLGKHSGINRRTFTKGLAAGAAVTGSRVALGQAKSASAQLDTDDGTFKLDAAALDHLKWWTIPPAVIRAYVGESGWQTHIRLAQAKSPRRRPLVLLHNAGLSGRVWNEALPLLAQDRAVIAPDLPAHGDSDGDPITSTEGHAAAVMRMATDLGLGRFDLVGDGLGAHVSIILASMAPDRIGRLVLSNVTESWAVPPRPDPINPENSDFLKDSWSSFTPAYGPAAPVGLLDRDFADLLRARADQPRNNGALAAFSDLPHSTLILRNSEDAEVGTRRYDHASALFSTRRGAASLQTSVWVKTVTDFLDEGTSGEDARSVARPAVSPPKGALVRRFLDTPGGQMHYRIIAGDDGEPPLLCFHMSPRSGAYYQPLMSALEVTGRTVIAVDTAGYGESFKPPAWLNVPGYGEHMANFIDALGAPQVDLLGDHTGGKIAIETTRQRPDKVRRIIMSTAGVYSIEEQRGWQNRMASIPVRADGSHFAALWDRYHTLNRGKLDSNQNAFRFYETVRAGPCMWWGSRAANLYILGQILPDIEHEILLVCSDEDSLIEPSRRAAKILRNGRYVEFPGQGNSMVEYRAAAVAPTIAAFLAS